MKMLRSRKALSPVVASIILIAVTVAVSIAVAAWMGALTFNFMATEQGQITNLGFTAGAHPSGVIVTTFNNTGTNAITISEVWVNNVKQVSADITWGSSATVQGNSGDQCTITPAAGVVAGSQYEVKLVSSKGNTFMRIGTAPT
jgi:flagellin-like protein